MNIKGMKIIKLAELGSLEEMNASRIHGSYFTGAGDFGELVKDLSFGWNATLGCVRAIPVKDCDAIRSTDHAAAVMAARIARLAELKHTKETAVVVIPVEGANDEKLTLTGADAAIAYEEMYFENGKPVKPKYIMNNSFRRSYCLPWTNALLYKRCKGEGEVPEGLYLTMDCQVVVYEDEVERIDDNLRENTHKTKGAVEVSKVATLVNVQRLCASGYSEARIQETFALNRGNAQKYVRICKLDAAHMDAELIENVILSAPEPDKLIASYHKETLHELLEGKSTGPRKRTGIAAGLEQVSEYFMNPKGSEDAPKRPASKSKIETLLQSCKVKAFKVVLQAVLDDKLETLGNYAQARKELNAVWDSATEGMGSSNEVEDTVEG